MKFTVDKIDSSSVYIKSENSVEKGGFALTLVRVRDEDNVGFVGNKEFENMCLSIADVVLGGK